MIGDEKTMMSILLRHEAFGGLLFRPEDAVHVELDREAFAFMTDPRGLRLLPDARHRRLGIGPELFAT